MPTSVTLDIKSTAANLRCEECAKTTSAEQPLREKRVLSVYPKASNDSVTHYLLYDAECIPIVEEQLETVQNALGLTEVKHNKYRPDALSAAVVSLRGECIFANHYCLQLYTTYCMPLYIRILLSLHLCSYAFRPKASLSFVHFCIPINPNLKSFCILICCFDANSKFIACFVAQQLYQLRVKDGELVGERVETVAEAWFQDARKKESKAREKHTVNREKDGETRSSTLHSASECESDETLGM
ncbi:unnamed protein product [Cylicocyclus nassatus]|uniref:Uncharacterized protein n=1 Tax=Cylicocyclus nassatus TaxID=53992 RepID=A0AA36H9U5_CYLNA|nr:unnamed protein product [Cylicocyclus nassatus]